MELRQRQIAIAQHCVVREMHLHAIQKGADYVVTQQCAKLGTIAALDNVE